MPESGDKSLRKSFTSAEVCRLAGISYRQLDHWVTRDWVGGDQAANPGSGYARRFTQADVDRARELSVAAFVARFSLPELADFLKRRWRPDLWAAAGEVFGVAVGA